MCQLIYWLQQPQPHASVFTWVVDKHLDLYTSPKTCLTHLETQWIIVDYKLYVAGIERSGLLGILAEIAALTLCVVSVWCPGSPFDILSSTNHQEGNISATMIAGTNMWLAVTQLKLWSHIYIICTIAYVYMLSQYILANRVQQTVCPSLFNNIFFCNKSI